MQFLTFLSLKHSFVLLLRFCDSSTMTFVSFGQRGAKENINKLPFLLYKNAWQAKILNMLMGYNLQVRFESDVPAIDCSNFIF